MFLTFSQTSSYFCNNLSSFIKKDTDLVSSKPFLYAFILGGNIHEGLIFLNIFGANKKKLNPFLSKETLSLLGTTILSMSTVFD